MIRVWAVRSEQLASKLIRFGLNQDASHLALGISGAVYHSSIHGTEWLAHEAFWWGKQPKEIACFVELEATPEQEARIRDAMMAQSKQGYDWLAFAFFSWRCLLQLTLRIPLPTRGPDGIESSLCVEALYSFLEIYCAVTGGSIILPGKELSVMSPRDCVEWIGRSFNTPVLT